MYDTSYRTLYTSETFVIRDNHGNYLKEDSTDPDAPIFIVNENCARQWNNVTSAQNYADSLNARYITYGITDVWGQPKRVKVYKMTVSTFVEPVTESNPNQLSIKF